MKNRTEKIVSVLLLMSIFWGNLISNQVFDVFGASVKEQPTSITANENVENYIKSIKVSRNELNEGSYAEITVELHEDLNVGYILFWMSTSSNDSLRPKGKILVEKEKGVFTGKISAEEVYYPFEATVEELTLVLRPDNELKGSRDYNVLRVPLTGENKEKLSFRFKPSEDSFVVPSMEKITVREHNEKDRSLHVDLGFSWDPKAYYVELNYSRGNYFNEHGHVAQRFYQQEDHHYYDKSMTSGTYKLQSVDFYSREHTLIHRVIHENNLPNRALHIYESIAKLNAQFDIKGVEEPQLEQASVKNILMSAQKLYSGQSVDFTVELMKEITQKEIVLSMKHNQTYSGLRIHLAKVEGTIYQGTFEITERTQIGEYHLEYLIANNSYISIDNDQFGSIQVIRNPLEKPVTLHSLEYEEIHGKKYLNLKLDSAGQEVEYIRVIYGEDMEVSISERPVIIEDAYYVHLNETQGAWENMPFGMYPLKEIQVELSDGTVEVMSYKENVNLFVPKYYVHDTYSIGEEYNPVKGITIDKTSVSVGDVVTVTLTLEQPRHENETVTGYWINREAFLDTRGNISRNLKETIFHRISDKVYQAKIPVEKDELANAYLLSFINFTGVEGTMLEIMNLMNQYGRGDFLPVVYDDFSHIHYEVENPKLHSTTTTIEDIIIKSSTNENNRVVDGSREIDLYPGDTLEVELHVSHAPRDLASIEFMSRDKPFLSRIPLKKKTEDRYIGTVMLGDAMNFHSEGIEKFRVVDALGISIEGRGYYTSTYNKTNAYEGLRNVTFNWKGEVDQKAPVLRDVFQNPPRIRKGEEMVIRMDIQDEDSGIEEDSVAITLQQHNSMLLMQYPMTKNREGLYEVRIPTRVLKEGLYEIIELTARDEAGNRTKEPFRGSHYASSERGINLSFLVMESEFPLLDTLRIHQHPEKLTYRTGESIDLKGLTVIGTYMNGEEKEVTITEDMIQGFNSSEPMKQQKITITVEEVSVDFFVEILEQESIRRVSGANRFHTAVEISKETYEKAEVAILVQSSNFPDALAAGPLAYMVDAPILLTGTANLSSAAKVEMERLGVKDVILMGGFSAISENVEKTLQTEGYTVKRLEGSNRYTTAVETAQFMETKLGQRKTAVLASGKQFADALAAGSYAAKEGLPILLTDGIRLTQTTIDYLKSSGVTSIILVGGTSVISEVLEAQLKTLGITITRKSGRNRFDTSLDIAQSYFKDAESVVVANGMEFADALAAAPYAAKMNAPILLVNQSRINQPIKEYLPMSAIKKVIVVGGDAAVGEAVRNDLESLITIK